ncbi:MAG: polyphosphate polymerase domain-containing protein [Clostridia bacterium]|nr:polyphosphate polymerase domain-containing protein [Clostridia bacterium]
MSYKNVFHRFELKYLITPEQKKYVLDAISGRMCLDAYGKNTIRNVYYDTDTYALIRRSIEKPIYKEKLRIRSYQLADSDSMVFVELKKKYDKVVYKRRISLPEAVATAWVGGDMPSPCDTQISREIDYFKTLYSGLRPSMFLSYEREAFYDLSGGDFRVTFDDNILCRTSEISVCKEPYGHSILPENRVLMEIKCPGAIPLWMVNILSQGKIYKTSFSKYGTAYTETVLAEQLKVKRIAKEIKINA